MSTETPRGTRAGSPDLDWSQVRETVLMLELAAGQVDAAMRDSNSSVDTLMDTFTSMADTLATIDVALGTLPDTIGNGMVKTEIQDNARQVAQKVHQAIIAFQFYDKLVQRLAHVGISLGDLSDLVANTQRLFNPNEWVQLQQKIKVKYTTREEIAMFDAVMNGMPVQEAVDKFMAEMKEKPDDIELF